MLYLQGDNDLTEILLKRLNQSGKLHCVPASIKGKYIIRYTVTSTHTVESDLERDWTIIQDIAQRIINEKLDLHVDHDEEEEHEEIIEVVDREEINIIHKKDVISSTGLLRREGMKKNKFGMSLILSNVPMSPKFINGSFAALFDTTDIITEYARQLCRRSIDFNGQPIRLSPRKRLKEQSKQYSFDLSRVPPRKGFQTYKQASLDSKIEEIFENSELFEDADEEDEDEFNDQSGNSIVAAVQKRLGLTMEDKAVQSPTSPPFWMTSEHVQVELPLNGNPPSLSPLTLRCKHCGHVIDE